MLEIDPHLVANSDKDDFEFVGFATLLVIVFSKTFFLVGLSTFDWEYNYPLAKYHKVQLLP